MSKSLAVAISVGVVAGLWTFLGSGYLSFASIAIGFIAWAASGLVGKSDAMQKTVIGMTFGAIIAGLALGILALRTRSILYCIITHASVMFFIDLISVLRFRANDYGAGLYSLIKVLKAFY